MEKLIELLNEYQKELHGVDRAYKDGFDLGYEQEYMRDFRVAYLISKSFGFIKRLVYENKIDHEKIKSGKLNGCKWYFETVQPEYFVIMLLAISENPIEDLISYLK